LIYNYFAQWLILTGLYRPEEAMVMLDKEESLLQESGKKKRLGRKLRKAIVHSANVGAVLREPGVPEETRIAVSGAGR